MDGIERITTLEVICSSVYFTLTDGDRLRDEQWFTSYDLQYGLKHIIVDLVEYFITTYNTEGVWERRVVDLIIRAYRPKSTVEQLDYIAKAVHSSLNKELGIKTKGYRLAYRIENNTLLRFHVLQPIRLRHE